MKNILLKIIKAKEIVAKLLQDNPEYGLWQSVSAQLDFIFRDYDTEGICLGAAGLDRVSQIILGLQAVREIEPGNPEFAELLCEIDYFYKKQYGIV